MSESKMQRGFKSIHNDLNITFIIFLVLKGAGLVNWTWWVIMSPYFARLLTFAIEGSGKKIDLQALS